MERRLPILSFDVVCWDDGRFEFIWRDFATGSVGFSNARHHTVREMVTEMERIVAEADFERGRDRLRKSHDAEPGPGSKENTP